MKIIREIEGFKTYKEITFEIYVIESATNFYCTAKHVGWAMPCSENWKYPKKEFKTINQAINQHVKELYKRYRG